jgi:hypothetical protein
MAEAIAALTEQVRIRGLGNSMPGLLDETDALVREAGDRKCELTFARHAASRLVASAVMINDHTAFRADWMPFAGLRQSGLGTGGMPDTFEDMRIEKLVVWRAD